MLIDLVSRCRCGQCELKISGVPLEIEPSNTFDCHCSKCRKYHGSAFTSFLKVNEYQIEPQEQSTIKYYTDSCDEIGPTIERVFCSQCKCKLATRSHDASPLFWYLNMGSIADESIPTNFSSKWRKSRVSKQSQQSAVWYPASPKYHKDDHTPQYQLTGGCSCGSARFLISNLDIPNVFEHCYCRLCRQMGGSAFVSWPRVCPQNFRWLSKEPTLMRTTDFGQRHVCDTCGVCLTIVYDDEEDSEFIYPTAGSIDVFPNIDCSMKDVMHIYCFDNAAWYELPVDGLPRFSEGYEECSHRTRRNVNSKTLLEMAISTVCAAIALTSLLDACMDRIDDSVSSLRTQDSQSRVSISAPHPCVRFAASMILANKIRRFCTFAIGVALQRIMKNETSIDLVSRCRCGQCELKISRVPRKSEPSNTFDCHCAKCRKYHGSAFTSYLKVNEDQIEPQKQSSIKYYVDSCDEIGPIVERVFCRQCKCKLATRSNGTSPSIWYLNMGSIADESIRADFSNQWRKSRVSKQSQQAAAWYPAIPNYDEDDDIPQYQFTGGCSCGSARFMISNWDVPNELPHCYCRLCRQMSGSAFVSWPWVSPRNFRWLTKEPTLMRTTDFGQRHVCDTCGACLTIIYDDKENEDFVYPTAGSIDAFPNVDGSLGDVTHIYCDDNAAWYDLPNDGLPRYFEGYED